MKTLNRVLYEAGILVTRDNEQGQRYGRHGADKRIVVAYGELSPLAQRYDESVRIAAAARLERARMKESRSRITLARRAHEIEAFGSGFERDLLFCGRQADLGLPWSVVGSVFTGKAFAAFDNVASASSVLLSQTLYNAAGAPIQQIRFDANGTIHEQDTVAYVANGTDRATEAAGRVSAVS